MNTNEPSPANLQLAASWLDEYDGGPGDETEAVMHLVAAWLYEQAEREEMRLAVREIQDGAEAATGLRPSAARVRKALANAMASSG